MKKQTLAIISILVTGFIIGSVAYGQTVITDTSITTPTLTVTSSCSGCGGGEGSYSHYNTIALNTTTAGHDNSGICDFLVGNDGSAIIGGSIRNQLVYLNGTTVYNQSQLQCNKIPAQIGQSSTGKYKLLQDDATNLITIFKDTQKLQNLGIKLSQCNILNGDQEAISPDGHYIGFVCEDSGLGSDRLVILQGT